MALVLGTNCGFVTVAPTGDPAGANFQSDNRSTVCKFTSPATAAKITEIGWYCTGATEEANFEVGVYDTDGAVVPGEAGTLLHSDTTNAKGTTAGWKTAAVNFNISASTDYWLAYQLDNTTTWTGTDYSTSGGAGLDMLENRSSLQNPHGGGAIFYASGIVAIYAVWEAAAGGTNTKINIGDTFKDVSEIKINIGDAWKDVSKVQVNIGDAWKTVFG